MLQMAIFMEQLQKVKDHEKRVKSSFQVHLGTEPPTQAEQERMAALRAEHAARMRAREYEAAASRTETELHVAGALCARSGRAVTAQAESGPAIPDSSKEFGPQTNNGGGDASADHGCQESSPSEYVMDALRGSVLHDDLAKRAFSRNRFLAAGRLIIIR